MAQVEQQVTQAGDQTAQPPTLYVCHGDDGGPRIHPSPRAGGAA